ncbi:hypothetical protein QVD17_05564 [Tagetes erecta]|uniref:Uncharacterized protein n=1 Tax=Tagetes erecta TaxID=13708 RepID=A0AAD8PB90_TARER|nr:hypothetical protein QVD17_05564 [Tagetes erecta]
MNHGDTPTNLGESEPPHIKNWFSSYEYESFVLETNDNFGYSDDQESQGFENDCNNGNTSKSIENSRELATNGKNEGILIKCNQSDEGKNQVLESPDSPFLSSEPPGIEKWFSSYVYESPEVDTIDDLILSDHKESVANCHEKTKEFEKYENMCVTPDDLICKQISECDDGILKTKELEKDEDLCITHVDLVCKQISECDNSSVKDNKNPTESLNNSANVKSFENGSRKLEEPGDGFVSIKSKRENVKRSKQVNSVDQKRCAVSSANKMKKKKSDERVTLGDVTNILEEHSSVTGKWKCPRKRKPEIGPPLKQLRLGQWFHHV